MEDFLEQIQPTYKTQTTNRRGVPFPIEKDRSIEHFLTCFCTFRVKFRILKKLNRTYNGEKLEESLPIHTIQKIIAKK